MSKTYYVYILANERPTLYIGVTNDLRRRIFEHKTHVVEGFTSRYGVSKLVYYEETPDIEVALNREKRLKHWNRKWKLDLITETNPSMTDLSLEWYDSPIKS